MNLAIAVWLFFRGLRWAAWVFFFGFSFYFWLDRAPWLTGNRSVPQRGWNLLDEVRGDETIRSPGAENRLLQVRNSSHLLETAS